MTLASGCFWCLDAVFQQLRGVESSVVGYAGGSAEDASYYRVVTGQTGHAESIQVTFDETILPSDIVLDMFFTLHDPTTPSRQGADVGPQYRSVMFYENDEQKALFEAAKTRAQKLWDDPIVTEIAPLEGFYPAEIEHQEYYANNPANGYCSVVIAPKVNKARQNFSQYMKPDELL